MLRTRHKACELSSLSVSFMYVSDHNNMDNSVLQWAKYTGDIGNEDK